MLKNSLYLLLILNLMACSFFKEEVNKQLKCTLVNESGLTVEHANLHFFNYEVTKYKGDNIEIQRIKNGESLDVLYNLENVEGFNDLTVRLKVEFKESSKILEKDLATTTFRRLNIDNQVVIKQDTLIDTYQKK